MRSVRIIAIDGPSASGKSTVARYVADKLGYVHVDSGSLYRGVTWKALRDGIAPTDTNSLVEMVLSMEMRILRSGLSVRFTIDGVDPSSELRSEAVRERVSIVAAIPQVRARVVEWLRGMRTFGSLVMEGRDIGSAVFPDAEFKFYLDANAEERARRRCEELDPHHQRSDLASVQSSLARRDKIDSTRKTAPLKIADGAVVVDTNATDANGVASLILDHVNV